MTNLNETKAYKWVVIGAGPGGLGVLGNLISLGVPESQILWVDPSFTSGNLSDVHEVPSNTKVALFIKFFAACPYLNDRMEEVEKVDPHSNPFAEMRKLPQDQGCFLKFPCQAITSVTQRVLMRVPHIRGWVQSLSRGNNQWTIDVSKANSEEKLTIESERVAFCTGSVPRDLTLHEKYSGGDMKMIPLQDAFSPTKLKELIGPKDVVAVMGTSHSGILVLRNLVSILPDEHSHKLDHVRSFSKYPLLYAEYMDGWIKNDNTGLKLVAADWAREHYEKNPHPLISKFAVGADEHSLYQTAFKPCTKIVYAVGYDRVRLPKIEYEGNDVSEKVSHNKKNGQLETEGKSIPGLFGFGIAFPELKLYPNGKEEMAVGMWKFMDYGLRVVPQWTQ